MSLYPEIVECHTNSSSLGERGHYEAINLVLLNTTVRQLMASCKILNHHIMLYHIKKQDARRIMLNIIG